MSIIKTLTLKTLRSPKNTQTLTWTNCCGLWGCHGSSGFDPGIFCVVTCVHLHLDYSGFFIMDYSWVGHVILQKITGHFVWHIHHPLHVVCMYTRTKSSALKHILRTIQKGHLNQLYLLFCLCGSVLSGVLNSAVHPGVVLRKSRGHQEQTHI